MTLQCIVHKGVNAFIVGTLVHSTLTVEYRTTTNGLLCWLLLRVLCISVCVLHSSEKTADSRYVHTLSLVFTIAWINLISHTVVEKTHSKITPPTAPLCLAYSTPPPQHSAIEMYLESSHYVGHIILQRAHKGWKGTLYLSVLGHQSIRSCPAPSYLYIYRKHEVSCKHSQNKILQTFGLVHVCSVLMWHVLQFDVKGISYTVHSLSNRQFIP